MKRSYLYFILLMLLINSNIYAQCVTSYPFVEDFEIGPSGWITGGANSDWTWGTPAKVRITSAGSGNSCWISGGLTNTTYNGGEKAWLQSPCFDFTSVPRPYVQFLIFWDTERQYDGGNLQYSTNSGSSWQNVGFNSINSNCKTANWFNAPSITNLNGLASPTTGWSGSTLPTNGSCLGGNGSGQWVTASYCLSYLAGEADVLFRFTFCSGTSCNNYDGIAIDSFSISNLPEPTLDFTYTCETNNQVRFEANGGDCPTTQTWDFGDPASGNNTSTSFTEVHTFSSPGTYVVTFTIDEPCIGIIATRRTVIIPDISAEIFPLTCNGSNDGSIQLTVSPYPNLQLSWNTSPPQAGTTLSDLPVGNYQVTLTADSTCTLTKSYEVTVNGDGGPNPSLPSDVLFCSGDVIALQPGEFDSYLWSTGSTENTLMITDTGWYAVTVTDLTGCTGQDSVFIKERCFTGMFVPSSFTPNDDGINDFFRSYSGDVFRYSLKIYNTYGQELFVSDQQEIGWDGMFEKEFCQNGIYIWQIKYQGPDLKSRTERGLVSLFR
ncbi:MAG: gliding motility-associated C-terminal domain-containing protein [Bacteroidetes bacterium]|nr:gliding motility-associated C-terminal domain-containing protein [Bacteroidota bacterium]